VSGTSVGLMTRRICSILWRSGLWKGGWVARVFSGCHDKRREGGGESSSTHQTTMHGKDLLINDRGNGETVETIGESLPKLYVVSPFA
jgi:hypothetical protein